jgi:hypothetical protein
MKYLGIEISTDCKKGRLCGRPCKEEKKDPSKALDENEKCKFKLGRPCISGVHCGSNIDRIAVVVDTTESNDILYTWDMNINAEVDSVDIGKKFEIIFDSKGDIIVANDKNCIYDGTFIEVFDVNEKSI